ncbi:conserved exported hypothetical protein [Capnocytophaga cynodegmi]|uniref:Uncharacterized protein n=3 Tax=Capnocytophaga cynodegmi TaxID=28189 RepID=A0A0B7H9V5_9FLAO|nr:conserved exported hypothetical protein [Capnocytophaga cynodegmi]
MKILITLFLCSFLGFSQSEKNYILLNELISQNKVKKYTLNTKKMYGIKAEIEIYNVLESGNLLLLTILPDLDGDNIWEEIPFFFIEDKIVSIQDVKNNMSKLNSTKVFRKYRIVKEENNKFYVTKNTLLEIFKRFDFNTSLQFSGSNIINIKQNIMTYQDVKKEYIPQFDEYSPMEGFSGYMGTIYINKAMSAIYLSQIEQKDNEKIYYFWTFDDWRKENHYTSNRKIRKEIGNYSYHRGIDRFAYIEGKGIVGGSYDFYFDRTEDGFKRVVRYDIMWAKELFPERQ